MRGPSPRVMCQSVSFAREIQNCAGWRPGSASLMLRFGWALAALILWGKPELRRSGARRIMRLGAAALCALAKDAGPVGFISKAPHVISVRVVQ